MQVGRKPKPTSLKLLAGNPGKRKINDSEPHFDLSQPSPPPFLSDDAKVEWGRLCSTLFMAGVMTEADRAVFAAYCQSYGRWAQAERQIAKLQEKSDLNGLLSKTQNENIIQHPLIGIANKAHSDMVRYATEFGMTAASRTRVDAASGAGKNKNTFSNNGKRTA